MIDLTGFVAVAARLDFILYTGLGVAALLVAGLLAALVCARLAPTLRHTIMAGALVGALALPGLRLVVQVWPDAGSSPSSRVPEFQWTPDPASPASLREIGAVLPDTLQPAHRQPVRWLLVVWALGSVALAVRLGLGRFRLRSTVVRARPLESGVWYEELSALARVDGLPPPPIKTSNEVGTPFVSGVLSPVLVVPEGSLSASADERRAILLHELAHIRRHDTGWLLAATIGRVLYWPLPPIWWLTNRLCLEAERTCDEAVVSGGVARAAYIRQLMRAADAAATRPMWTPALGTPELYRRLHPLASGRAYTPPPRRAHGAVALLALVATLAAASLEPPARPFSGGAFFFEDAAGASRLD